AVPPKPHRTRRARRLAESSRSASPKARSREGAGLFVLPGLKPDGPSWTWMRRRDRNTRPGFCVRISNPELFLLRSPDHGADGSQPRSARTSDTGDARRGCLLRAGVAWTELRPGVPALGLRVLPGDAQRPDPALRRALSDPPAQRRLAPRRAQVR